ncbi:MAG: helix-turn-helix domain-containing protein [Anaerorhabdus sp.]
MSTKKYEVMYEHHFKDSPRLLLFTESSFENDWASSTHSHHFTEVIYVTSGTGVIEIDKTSFKIEKNNIIVLNPYIKHTEYSSENDHLSYYILSIKNLVISFKDNLDYCIVNDKKNKIILGLFTNLLSEIKLNTEISFQLTQYYLEIIILNICRLANTYYKIEATEKVDQVFFKVKKYIEENYEKKITLDILAKRLNISKYHLSHKFKKTYNISPISYLNKTRVKVCKELLNNTDYSISEISIILGFSSLSYLSQQFKKYEKMSPQQYRNLNN